MRSSPPLALAALAALVLSLAACGDDGDGAGIDASSIDAPPGTIDAAVDAPMAQSVLGTACTGMGQGTCPVGYECLNLNGGSGTWCSKTCADPQDPSCEVGYAGPGFPACLLRVTPNGGGTPRQFCLIICEDLPGNPTICLPGECTGTCPAPLMCNANLSTGPVGMETVVARACK